MPKPLDEQNKWTSVLPPREGFVIKRKSFFICQRHWPTDTPMKAKPGGFTRPVDPPSIFNNVPSSCLPTSKPSPRPPKDPMKHLRKFLEKDKIGSFQEFTPDKDLREQFKNVIISRSDTKFVCIFMSEDFRECTASISVHNKTTLCSPMVVEAFKCGIHVSSVSSILNPNNGLSTYSQFFEVVNRVHNFKPTIESVVAKVAAVLDNLIDSE